MAAASTLLLALGASGCIGNLGDTSSSPGDEDPLGNDSAAQCAADGPSASPSPLRRLTRREYQNSVQDLLDVETDLGTEFVPDQIVGGFASNSVTAVSESEVEDFLDAAEKLATQAVAEHGADWFACGIDDEACVAPVLADLAYRAFRRPVPADVEASLLDLYKEGKQSWTADKGVELALQAILSSPYFLYHLEYAEPAEGDAVVPLDGFEVASRMSYFFWHSLPDAELLAAAAEGQLATPEGIETQARRMLEHAHASRAIEVFHREWLELEALDGIVKDNTMFENWNDEIAEAAQRETLAFIDDIVQGGGDAGQLFTATHSFVDGALADIYGVDVDATEGELARVELDPSQRAGLLTQVSFLASRAHAAETSWVLRGKFVREKLLCETIPAPPPNVNQTTANDPDRLKNPECMSCHLMMDPIGVGFENYDPIGQFITEDDEGEAIDASGEVIDPSEQIGVGTFNGAVELSKEIAESDRLRECMTTQWFRYAVRHADTKEDACSIQTAFTTFEAAGFDVRELMVAIATSDGFRHRKAVSE